MQKCVAFLFIFGTNYITMDYTKILQLITHKLEGIGKTSETVVSFAAGLVATSNQTSTGVDGDGYKYASFQLVASTLDASDGVIKLQDSNDNSNWNDISGATITVASGSNTNMIRYTAFTCRYIRAVWTKGSNTTGTLTGTFYLKK